MQITKINNKKRLAYGRYKCNIDVIIKKNRVSDRNIGYIPAVCSLL